MDTKAMLEAVAANRAAEPVRQIDYDRAKRNGRKLKAQLTRALNTPDPDVRVDKVVDACLDAMEEWDEWGCWPDDWARWEAALSQVLVNAPTLRELQRVG